MNLKAEALREQAEIIRDHMQICRDGMELCYGAGETAKAENDDEGERWWYARWQEWADKYRVLERDLKALEG